jgi:FixJ family two-component response regulator
VISVVDDDESIRDATRTLLRSVGYSVGTFVSAEQFLESDALPKTECLIVDVRMPGMSGLELQSRLKSSDLGVPIIFVSAHDDKAYRRQAFEAGAIDFFRKPFEASALVTAVQTALSGHAKGRQGLTASGPSGQGETQ